MNARNELLFQSTSNDLPKTTRSQNELLRGDVASTVVDLVENNNEPTCFDETQKPEDVNHSSKRRKRQSLQFNETVTVVAIPMRNEYCRQVRSKLWSNRLELQQNIARNVVEFAAEGWNWRTVVEDERMHVCAFSGQRIHPIHCDPDFDIDRVSVLKRETL
ncbi:hypothetical protein FisN_30Lh039 [Fistulifera solaris]|uniref:Uncharacterized protein n=1 Tax=Fistulifera solaris TaxID=1519565 RepID=A0A1Z5JIB4_FISSO|nr:hypothetical protein FisN_30Lh039 [Fistulifera solaris]|eukprot:GAX13753.1 hypothetical protein FisN_30Lh039 [Fistulifera solaris]